MTSLLSYDSFSGAVSHGTVLETSQFTKYRSPQCVCVRVRACVSQELYKGNGEDIQQVIMSLSPCQNCPPLSP
jgi:hypothetical protein